ncbi:MAG: hypothetical protein ACFN4P_09400, partial [Propionibacterium acidifaciens]
MSTTASRTAGPAPGRRAALVGPARHALGQVLKCASLVLAVSALTFFLAKASPMDPVESYLGAENAIDPSQYAALTAKWGLDRPVSGLVMFAKTSKALTRLNNMFRAGEV